MKESFSALVLPVMCLSVIAFSCGGSQRDTESGESVLPTSEDCIAFAGEQLFRTAGYILKVNLSEKKLPEGPFSVDDKFPRFIQEDGTWAVTGADAWSSGFFSGCLWLMYEYTGDEQWRHLADIWTRALESQKDNATDHNTGYRMMPGFANAYRLTGDDYYRQVLVEAARSLASRFSRKVGMIRANDSDQWRYPVFIDTMVSLELLFWAARNGGHSDWYEIAETHALNTIKHHIREDGSTIQVVDFDPETGAVIKNDTLCGLSPDSKWSRGDAEAIYGFSMAYRETGNPVFLSAARKVADAFIAGLPEDSVPYWDRSDPGIPNAMRDASAASMAADGLLELRVQVADEALRERYTTAAVTILEALGSPAYRADPAKSMGFVAHATWKKPTDPQADTSLIWGDYAYLEALMRYRRGVDQGVEAGVPRLKTGDPIRAFCIDFNWGPDGFAPPGMYAQADPGEHIAWYKALGVNTIQTFCTNCCGYAWYKSDIAPVQPGMEGDFLAEITELGHREGMKVIGYFCVGANTWWGENHPWESYGTPSRPHIPLTTEYLDYLCSEITEVLTKTAIDGFMVDWMFHIMPGDTLRWLPCEQAMYLELMGAPFPGKKEIKPWDELKFRRLSADRAWKRIRQAAKAVKPNCIVWLSSHRLLDRQVEGLTMIREADWLMNEHPDPAVLDYVKSVIGPRTRLIQCLSGWGAQHDAAKILDDPYYRDIGFYGFARPDTTTTLPPEKSDDPALAGNARNIAIMRRAFTRDTRKSTPEPARIAPDMLEGAWLNKAIYDTLLTTKSPYRAIRGIYYTACEFKRKSGYLDWLVALNFHEGMGYPLAALETTTVPDMYRPVFHVFRYCGDIAANNRFVITDSTRPASFEWLFAPRFPEGAGELQLTFVRVEPTVEDYINRVCLAGTYTDEKGREFVFTDDQTALWPERSFDYHIGLDHVITKCDYIYSVGERFYSFAWENGKLLISNVHPNKEFEEQLIPDDTPLYVLTPVGRM